MERSDDMELERRIEDLPGMWDNADLTGGESDCDIDTMRRDSKEMMIKSFDDREGLEEARQDAAWDRPDKSEI